MISNLGKYIYYTVSSRKSSDSFFLLTLKGSIDTIEEQLFWINQSSSFFKNIIRKKIKWSFFKHRKRRSVLSGIYPNKILWLLWTQRGPSLSNQTNLAKEGVDQLVAREGITCSLNSSFKKWIYLIDESLDNSRFRCLLRIGIIQLSSWIYLDTNQDTGCQHLCNIWSHYTIYSFNW